MSSYRTKLIEVALPLAAINEASAREKSIRHGHPSTLHLWWARRPLAVCRAVLFCQLVDDPSASPEHFPTERDQHRERQRLFRIVGEMVKWENTQDDVVFNAARLEIARSIARGRLSDSEGDSRDEDILSEKVATEDVADYLATVAPPVHDPFAGGGSIPLEAERLGLRAVGGDLNPVSVLINKALIEAPGRFVDRPPSSPDADNRMLWRGVQGLAEDIRCYGRWIEEKALLKLGAMYRPMPITPEICKERPDLEKYRLRELPVIAWLWARTVTSPNPAAHGASVPLVSTFLISKAKGKEVWLDPDIDRENMTFSFRVRVGAPPRERLEDIKKGTKPQRGRFNCILTNEPIPPDYIREQGKKGQLGLRLLAVVLKGDRQRVYLDARWVDSVEVEPSDFLDEVACPEISGYFNPPIYGYSSIGSLFLPRQKLALKTFCGLVREAREKCRVDSGDDDYASAIAMYLALGVSRMSNRLNSFCIWNAGGQKVEQIFSEQGVPMAWDFAEANPFSGSTGSWAGSLEWVPKAIERAPAGQGEAVQQDASRIPDSRGPMIVCTDPPYYSSITYADFSDFFYGTLKTMLRADYPDLFKTVSTPKSSEAVAAWHRFGGDRAKAAIHFTDVLSRAMNRIAALAYDRCPAAIFYAFKQKELGEGAEGIITAWESILEVLLGAGLEIVRTWPMRTEQVGGRKAYKNSLASSIVIICRPAERERPSIAKSEFRKMLKNELPRAIADLERESIAPVDVVQSLVGPGMSVFSRHDRVVEADGSAMSVRSALRLINDVVDETRGDEQADFDPETRFAVTWFESCGYNDGAFGDAEVLATARAVSVVGVQQSGLIKSAARKVRLLRRAELPDDWSPDSDETLTIWECVQHLIKRLDSAGEGSAASLLAKLGADAEQARTLMYLLYDICERKGWAEEAQVYNGLAVAWPELEKLAGEESGTSAPASQAELF